jgi:hypothetical protein
LVATRLIPAPVDPEFPALMIDKRGMILLVVKYGKDENSTANERQKDI